MVGGVCGGWAGFTCRLVRWGVFAAGGQALPADWYGGECLRRVGRLYLPTGAVYFGCRQCYALTYESCRMAHRWGRIARLMAEVATHADPKRLRRILAGLME